jgi:hypothetical protein
MEGRIMKTLSTLAAVALLSAGSAQAAPVVLNFDGAVNTNITNAYAGVTFLAPGSGTPVRTWATAGADTPGNVLGLTGQNNFFALNQQESTAIDIVFDTTVSAVSIRAAFVQASDFFLNLNGMLPFMAVYNSDVIAAANRIGLVVWDIAADACLNSGGIFCQSAYDTLDFTSALSDIKAIRISGFAPAAVGVPLRRSIFDTLTFDAAGGPKVPEPASIALVLLALAAMQGIRGSKTKKT